MASNSSCAPPPPPPPWCCSPSFGTKEGSCGYGAIPKDQYPYFSTAALAPSNKFYAADELQGCGQCFQIQCADDRAGGGCGGAPAATGLWAVH